MTAPVRVGEVEPVRGLARARNLPRLLLIDLSAVFWWKWHAAAGQPVDTAFEFAVGKVRQLAEGGFARVLVCLDTGVSFRSDIYSLYKANRPPKDEAAVAQMKRVQAALREHGFELVGARLHEADDVIATLTHAARERGFDVTIAGTDKDLLQLVSDGVSFLSIMSGDTLGVEEVQAKFGIPPGLIRDYLSLVGDSADNIKGVPGIGPKHAVRLLTRFGSAGGIVAALESTEADGSPSVTPPSIHKSLSANLDVLELARRLVSLAEDAPLELDRLLAPVLADSDADEEPTYPDDAATQDTEEETAAAEQEPTEEEPTMTTTSNGTTTTSTTNGAAPHPAPAPAPAPAPTVARPTTRFGGAKISTAPDRSPEKTIITGKSGIGKTHFVSTIPGVFILFIEDGLKGISADHSPAYFADEKDKPIFPRNLSELMQGLDEFAGVRNAPVNGKRPHRHLAIDGLTGIETLVLMEAMKVEKVPHMEAKEYKKIWAAAEPIMLGVQRKLDAIRATGVHVWVIAHSAEVIDASSTGAVYRKADLLMKGSGDTGVHARNMWRNWANHVFFIDWVTKVTKGDKSTRSIAKYEGRLMYTRENGQYFAKTRSRLPVSIPATWEDLAKAMAAGAAAAEPKTRAEVEAILPKLSEEDRTAIAADLATAQGANRLAAILSRAQGMIAVAASESDEGEGEPAAEADAEQATTEAEQETAA